jgi:hypothetical protein
MIMMMTLISAGVNDDDADDATISLMVAFTSAATGKSQISVLMIAVRSSSSGNPM